MRTLGIETSGLRGSIALVEDGRVLVTSHHVEANRHAEETLPAIERALAEVGWVKSSLDRIAVGTGPGSFTGLRVGLSLGIGLSLGLDRPALGVGSLLGLAATSRIEGERLRAASSGEGRVLVALRDARRDEAFWAAYDENFVELIAPRAAPLTHVVDEITTTCGERAFEIVGLRLDAFVARGLHSTSEAVDPDARAVALVAEQGDPALYPLEPNYVRDSGAIRPKLPPSPLSFERRDG